MYCRLIQLHIFGGNNYSTIKQSITGTFKCPFYNAPKANNKYIVNICTKCGGKIIISYEMFHSFYLVDYNGFLSMLFSQSAMQIFIIPMLKIIYLSPNQTAYRDNNNSYGSGKEIMKNFTIYLINIVTISQYIIK